MTTALVSLKQDSSAIAEGTCCSMFIIIIIIIIVLFAQ